MISATDKRSWLWSGLLLLAGGGSVCLLAFLGVAAPRAPLPADRTDGVGARSSEAAANANPAGSMVGIASSRPGPGADDPRLPPEFFRQYPPGSRIPMRVPFVAEGIEVSPGLFLPPLNGVKVEDGIPAIGRSPRLPPPGPVVAKVVAADGQEYWEHEDGSYTSCTYSQIRTPEGSKRIVATQHGAVLGNRGRVPGR